MIRPDVTVVIATNNRCAVLRRGLAALAALPERPQVVVVDNASTDATADVARAAGARVIRLESNLGAAARNAGAAVATTELVAFCDDDSHPASGALRRAAERFAADDRLALLAGRILVGDDQRLDPTCRALADGPAVLGFVACGAVARRDALLGVGGFHPRFGVGGEERLLALDLAAAGHRLAYAPEVVFHHHPGTGPRAGRTRQMRRNDLWTAWLRRPPAPALRATAATASADPPALLAALRGLPWILRERRTLPAAVERDVLALADAERIDD
jgi:N-acetylglucosaminyl-diphospho-decaprenol L-rhamnosyltransferase